MPTCPIASTQSRRTSVFAPNPDRDRYVAVAAELLLLRARDVAEKAARHAELNCGADPSDFPVASPGELARKYERLLSDWADEEPEAAGGVLAYVDLATAIVADQVRGYDEFDAEGGFLSAKQELATAARLLRSIRGWLIDQDIREARLLPEAAAGAV
jgi:hypothetical protein